MRAATIPDGREPYVRLLNAALAEQGIEIVDDFALNARSVRRARASLDVVHLHWVELLLRPTGGRLRRRGVAIARTTRLALAFEALARSPIRFVWTLHNLEAHEPRYPLLERFLARRAMRRADVVIAHSSYAARRVQAFLNIQRPVAIIPHASFVGVYKPSSASVESLRARYGIPAEAFVYLAFGQIRRYKRLLELASAFREIEDDHVRLLIAGKVADAGIARRLRSLAAADPRIVVDLRLIPDDEVADLHRAADCAVVAHRELFSSGALLLALSLGLPVVAARAGSAAEVGGYPAILRFEEGGLIEAMRIAQAVDPRAATEAARDAVADLSWASIARLTAEAYGAPWDREVTPSPSPPGADPDVPASAATSTGASAPGRARRARPARRAR